jgi:PKD domain
MRRSRLAAFAAACATLGVQVAAAQPVEPSGDNRPTITLRAQPSVVMASARVVLTAELLGGADDFEEYYCPSVEWDWGDGTVSQSTSDCDPYEPGRSSIKRRYTVEHTFRRPGTFRVYLRLKQQDKTVGTGVVSVIVRARPGESD